MNIQEVQALTDDEIRVKVAELRGWENVHRFNKWQEGGPASCKDGDLVGDFNGRTRCHLPNYPADLNACSSFEATFISDYHQAVKYSWNLLRAIRLEVSEDADDLNLDYCWHIAHAPARARCEALILTLTQP